jgi:hypothetical protein
VINHTEYQEYQGDKRGRGGGGTAPGVAVTTRPAARFLSSLEKSGGAPPRGGGDRGGVRLQFPCSLDKNGGGTAPPVAVTRRCTALTAAVYTGRTGVCPHSVASRLRSCGHRPRGDSAPPEHLLLGLHSRSPPHRTRHGDALGSAPRARLRLLCFTFFTTFANVLTLQVFHHHVQVC